MAKSLIGAIFGNDDDDEANRPRDESPEAAASASSIDPGDKPRSLPDAWSKIADQQRRIEERLVALEAVDRQILEATQSLSETAKLQLQVLNYLGRFSESSERRGREMVEQFRGVPDVLRTLPSATKEQAEKLSEIAARLYEKARDDTVNALKAAQAAHQRAVEDLIDKSLGASRRMTGWAMALAAASVVVAIWMYLNGPTR